MVKSLELSGKLYPNTPYPFKFAVEVINLNINPYSYNPSSDSFELKLYINKDTLSPGTEGQIDSSAALTAAYRTDLNGAGKSVLISGTGKFTLTPVNCAGMNAATDFIKAEIIPTVASYQSVSSAYYPTSWTYDCSQDYIDLTINTFQLKTGGSENSEVTVDNSKDYTFNVVVRTSGTKSFSGQSNYVIKFYLSLDEKHDNNDWYVESIDGPSTAVSTSTTDTHAITGSVTASGERWGRLCLSGRGHLIAKVEHKNALDIDPYMGDNYLSYSITMNCPDDIFVLLDWKLKDSNIKLLESPNFILKSSIKIVNVGTNKISESTDMEKPNFYLRVSFSY